VHISQLANRYVKSPHDVVSVGDVVTVWVMGVDQERKRVSLTMVKPGTERQRGQQGAGARRGGPGGPGEPREGDRGNRGQGQGRRGSGAGPGAARPPRPAGSALTSPPVGSPSVAVLAESSGGRRPERDRGAPAPGQGGPRFSDNRGQGSGPPGHGGGPPRPPGQQGQGHDSGPQGRGGPRGPYPGQGSGDRFSRQDRGPNPRPQTRPSRPSPPPPPLSKDALAGNVPLRTFGQLKQLWEAKVDPKDEVAPGSGGDAPQPLPKADHGSADAAAPQQHGSDAANPASTAPAETDPQGSSD
jgi:uncharacterized protein